jgi:hypothetical protein
MIDEALVTLTNPMVSLEEIKQGSPDGVDSFDHPTIRQFTVPGYGHTIHIISITAGPSAKQGRFSREARKAQLEGFFKPFDDTPVPAEFTIADDQDVAKPDVATSQNYLDYPQCLDTRAESLKNHVTQVLENWPNLSLRARK